MKSKRSPQIFRASIRLFPTEQGGLTQPFITVDESNGAPRCIGFPIGKNELWFDSRWEFNEPMIVPGTRFDIRLRFLFFSTAEQNFPEGTKFLVSRGRPIGEGVISGSEFLRKNDSMIWPQNGPSFHVVKPDLQQIGRFMSDNEVIHRDIIDLEFANKIRQLLKSSRFSFLCDNCSTWLLSDKEFVEFEKIVKCKIP